MKKETFVISPVTLWDNEQEQYFTKIGRNNKLLSLVYTVWGDTEMQSRAEAEKLLNLLN